MPNLENACPRCNSPWQKTISFAGSPSEYWYECSNPRCNSYFNSYRPQEHQDAFHKDGHTLKLASGGYGTGKTTMDRQEVYKHIFLTPNANILIGANVSSQYEQTVKRELEADIPAAFVKSYSTQKQYMDFINGARILYRPLDDEGKLRSYNLSMFLIIEGSEVKEESFTQLKTRLRNTNATLVSPESKAAHPNDPQKWEYLADWRKGIVETNPDSGWVKTKMLMVSDKIHQWGDCRDSYSQINYTKDPQISSHVVSTSANKYLPKNFIELNSANKPKWWVNRYLFGSFQYSEGLVYPEWASTIIEDFDIPRSWRRIVAFDYGLTDEAVYLFAAVDPMSNMLYFYKAPHTNGRNVKELAELYHREASDIPQGGLAFPPIIDPKSGPKRDYQNKTLSDHFLEYGIAFQPGYVNRDARIFRLNTYIESGRLKIMKKGCAYLLSELENLKFKADESEDSGYTGKPVDKDDHAVVCAEWITMELPANPRDLVHGIYNRLGTNLLETKEQIQKAEYDWHFSDSSPSPVDEFECVVHNYF